jgi:hypothetical protein
VVEGEKDGVIGSPRPSCRARNMPRAAAVIKTAAAIPSRLSSRPFVCSPITERLLKTCRMMAISGGASTPLTRAAQKSIRIALTPA